MSKKKEQSFTEKQFAHPSGILVGHKFFYRDDMVAPGFCGHWLKGIDYVRKLCGKLELTYDYGCALDSVVGPDGKLKQSPCYCGTDECRRRLY